MAYGASYATVADLEERLNQTDEGTFAALLDAASRAVESFTRRQFNRDTGEDPVASARRFRAVDRQRLPVDDFHVLTDLAVSVDGTALDVDTQVDPRPWNGIVNAQIGWPYFDLFRIGGCWPWNRRATITVTAHWGWAVVPAAIHLATLDVATVMSYSTSSEAIGPVRSEAIDGYSASYGSYQLGNLPDEEAPPELRKAVPYRRKMFGVA